MKLNNNTVLAVFTAIIALGLYAGLNQGFFSVVDESSGEVDIPYSCSIPVDCENAMIEDGAGTRQEIDFFKQSYDIECRSGSCVGVEK